MTWLLAKHTLKRVWLWTKTYWYIPAVVIYTLVLLFFFRRTSVAAVKVLETTIGSYKKQLEVLNKTHQDEIGRREEILADYHRVVSELESKYAEEEKKISESKKKSIKKIVEKYYNDTDGLAKEISEKFGITYVP